MVRLNQVCQFMHDDVIEDFRRRFDQPPSESQVATAGAAALERATNITYPETGTVGCEFPLIIRKAGGATSDPQPS